MKRTITDNSTRGSAPHRPVTAQQPTGRPLPSHLRDDAQTRRTPANSKTARAAALPANRSPSR